MGTDSAGNAGKCADHGSRRGSVPRATSLPNFTPSRCGIFCSCQPDQAWRLLTATTRWTERGSLETVELTPAKQVVWAHHGNRLCGLATTIQFLDRGSRGYVHFGRYWRTLGAEPVGRRVASRPCGFSKGGKPRDLERFRVAGAGLVTRGLRPRSP